MGSIDAAGKHNSKNHANAAPQLSMENFGPIASGSVELRPLTIFLGPNNSGKSYAARLIYSIMHSEHQYMHDIVELVFGRIKQKSDTIKKSRDLVTDVAPFDVKLGVKGVYDDFETELNRNFASTASELVRFKQKTCVLRVSSNIMQSKITIKGNTITHTKNPRWETRVEIAGSGKNSRRLVFLQDDVITLRHDVFTNFNRYLRRGDFLGSVYRHYHGVAPLVYYLPASRYGVLQSRQILHEGIIRHALYDGFEDIAIPKVPGIVGDFLESLLVMSTDIGPYSAIAEQLERDVLFGSIELRRSPPSLQIDYLGSSGQPLPLHRVSSMVSEIAPLVLYLKHLLRPSSFLIIEEPESHLDPTNQIYIAKCIVDLVRNGIRVLITTHSPYLVEQIGNYVQAGGLADSDRDKLPGGKNLYIGLNEIAAYVFDAKPNGSTIKKSNISVEDGIDQTHFVTAFENISEHSRMIERYHEHT